MASSSDGPKIFWASEVNLVNRVLKSRQAEDDRRAQAWLAEREAELEAVVSYDAIVEACRDAWNWLMSDPIRIRSITTRPWASMWN